MVLDILIAYDSKHGATAEVAEFIGKSLRDKKFSVKVDSLENNINPDSYQVVILGTALYMGQWRKKAVRFVKDYQDKLALKSFWIFATGPTGEGDPVDLLKGWKYPENLKEVIAATEPKDMTIFHGALDKSKLNRLERMTINMVKAPVGDFRDWDQVKEWSEKIATSLKEKQAVE